MPKVSYSCEVCGTKVVKSVSQKRLDMPNVKTAYCSQSCARKNKRGSNASNWKCGTMIDKDGYVYVHSPNHPYANRHGYVFQHRLVVEETIGRVLLPSEVVHHINEQNGDNRIENLVLFSSQAEHKKAHESGRIRDDFGRYMAKENVA